MPSTHAFISPSGMKKTLNCPGSLLLQKKYPNPSSPASARGTGVHAINARCLLEKLNPDYFKGWYAGELVDRTEYLQPYPPAGDEPLVFKVDKKMVDGSWVFVDYVRDVLSTYPDAELAVETKSVISEKLWGTLDVNISLAYDHLKVVDYKDGFTYVDEHMNPQLLTYAVGQLLPNNPLEYQYVELVIVQPNGLGAPIRTFRIEVPELLIWYREVLVPGVKKALLPNAELIPGPWCKDSFCAARHDCPALLQKAKEAAQGMFDVVLVGAAPAALPTPSNMSPEQRARICEHGDLVADFIKQVKDFEYGLALHNKQSWGKLVKGRTSRVWTDEQEAEDTLRALIGEAAYTERKLLSPAAAETEIKIRGGKAEALAELITKQEGPLVLVPLDHKKPAVDPLSTMFQPVNSAN